MANAFLLYHSDPRDEFSKDEFYRIFAINLLQNTTGEILPVYLRLSSVDFYFILLKKKEFRISNDKELKFYSEQNNACYTGVLKVQLTHRHIASTWYMMNIIQRADFSMGFILKVQLYTLDAHVTATCRIRSSMATKGNS